MNKKLLVIDDEPEWIDMVKTKLSDEYKIEGLLVDEGINFQEFEKLNADIILLDLNMPTPGNIIYDEIMKHDESCYIIVWSVLPTTNQLVSQLINRGARYVSKYERDMGFSAICELISSFEFNTPENIKALIVDDEDENIEIYSSILKEKRIIDIEIANNTDEARRKIEDIHYDLIIVDTYFKHSDGQRPDGIDFLNEIYRANNNSMFFLVTRQDDRKDFAEMDDLSNIKKIPICIDFKYLGKEVDRFIRRKN